MLTVTSVHKKHSGARVTTDKAVYVCMRANLNLASVYFMLMCHRQIDGRPTKVQLHKVINSP